jgi:hypothetical protein
MIKSTSHDGRLVYTYINNSRSSFDTQKAATISSPSAREWQATLTAGVPTYGQTIEFLEKKCQLLESLNLLHPKSNDNPNLNNTKNNMPQKRSTASHVATNKRHCTFCKNDDHTIFQCNEFLKLNVEERNGQARNLKLCLNCLRDNNFVNTCQSKFKCRKCNQSHIKKDKSRKPMKHQHRWKV